MTDALDPLRLLFAQRRNLRAAFDAKKEAEWDKLSENVESEISRLIVALNPKTSHLGRAMGTSDYRTAKTRKDRAFEEVYPDLNAPMSEVVATTYVWSQTEGGWKVTDPAGRSVVIALVEEDENKAAIVLSGDRDLAKMFTDDPEGGYLLWQKATAGN